MLFFVPSQISAPKIEENHYSRLFLRGWNQQGDHHGKKNSFLVGKRLERRILLVRIKEIIQTNQPIYS